MPSTASPSVALVAIASDDFTRAPLADDPSTTLARMAAVGQLQPLADARAHSRAALHDWQLAVLDAVGLSEARDRFPSAAVSQRGRTGAVEASECWAHLACVHFEAGLNDMAAALLTGEQALSDEDRSAIAGTLAAHLQADGYALHAEEGGEWCVRCPRELLVETLPPEAAFKMSIKEALPSGTDAAELRRVMTEMQMLLHDHPSNERRARAGLLAANSVWFWSVGSIAPSGASAALPPAFGRVDYLKGLYSLHAQPVHAEAFDVQSIVETARTSGSALAVIEPENFESLEAQWLRPLSWLLRIGTFSRLRVYYAGWRVTLQRSDLLRFWRRSLPPSRWSA